VGLGLFLERATGEFDCSGCEVNAHGLAEARRRAPGARLVRGSFESIPLDAPPHVVVAWDVLEHVAELDAALDAIRDRLVPGGTLIAVVPVYDGPLGWLVRRLDRDPTHVWKWPRAEWLGALGAHGFRVVDSGGIVRKLVGGRFYLHVTRPQALWRAAGSALWFVGRAPSPETRA
jgi:SAM-dependent methyltransferase